MALATAKGGGYGQQRKQMIIAMLYLLLYLGAGAVFYVVVEGWTFVDSMYFAIVTMSTVGYGDLDATTPGSKVFTVIYIAFGVLVVFVPVSKVIATFQAQAERKISRLAKERHHRLFQSEKGSNRSDAEDRGELFNASAAGEEIVQLPPLYLYYARGLLVWIIAFVVLVLASAGAFVAIEPDWGYGNALYHCWVTATTVGYGWNGLNGNPSQGAKAWASVYILLSTTLLATTVGHLSTLRATRHWQEQRNELLSKQLDVELIESLDTDGNGVDKLEFVVGMLTNLNLVQWTDIDPFLKQFDKMDTDKSGRLTRDDLRSHVEDMRNKALGGVSKAATTGCRKSQTTACILACAAAHAKPTVKASSITSSAQTFQSCARIHPAGDGDGDGECTPIQFCTPVMAYNTSVNAVPSCEERAQAMGAHTANARPF